MALKAVGSHLPKVRMALPFYNLLETLTQPLIVKGAAITAYYCGGDWTSTATSLPTEASRHLPTGNVETVEITLYSALTSPVAIEEQLDSLVFVDAKLTHVSVVVSPGGTGHESRHTIYGLVVPSGEVQGPHLHLVVHDGHSSSYECSGVINDSIFIIGGQAPLEERWRAGLILHGSSFPSLTVVTYDPIAVREAEHQGLTLTIRGDTKPDPRRSSHILAPDLGKLRRWLVWLVDSYHERSLRYLLDGLLRAGCWYCELEEIEWQTAVLVVGGELVDSLPHLHSATGDYGSTLELLGDIAKGCGKRGVKVTSVSREGEEEWVLKAEITIAGMGQHDWSSGQLADIDGCTIHDYSRNSGELSVIHLEIVHESDGEKSQ